MKWSFSSAKTFALCPRKWFYSQVLANAISKDPQRREAHLLKQLQSVSAWRGSLVDTVISTAVIPSISKGVLPQEAEIIRYAMNIAEQQIEFGKSKRHRSPQTTKTNSGHAYCAFHDLEYTGTLNEEELRTAKEEITTSLQNLMHSKLPQYISDHSSHLITQRSLHFHFADTSVVCTPDLIVFFTDKPPLIIDWKVHSFAYADYRLQLALYALALSRAKPHRDFPEFDTTPEQMHLVEYQLLKNSRRRYSLTEDDLIDLEDHIFQSVLQVKTALDGIPRKELQASHFQPARTPKACEGCQYKKLCCNSPPELSEAPQ